MVLLTLGTTVGGFFYGKKKWEEAPKDYVSSAIVSFHVRNIFVSSERGIQSSSAVVADANQTEVLRQAQSESFLKTVAAKVDLAKRWGVSPAEVVAVLQSALELDLDIPSDQLQVTANLNEPQDAADVANAVAEELPGLVERIDEENRENGMEQLVLDSQPFIDDVTEAKERLKAALAAKNINIEPGPGVDLGDYLFIEEVRDGKLEWETAKESLEVFYGTQREYRNYWSKRVKPSMVTQQAVAPATFVGPPLRPYEARWSVYGMTVGLISGTVLMLICWKLFP